VRAPFDGRVLEKNVDVGQFVARGSMAATVYATDVAEIRLPIPDDELAFFALPPGARSGRGATGPSVVLTADFAGRRHEWTGRIVRTDGRIDQRTRLVQLVAEVRDPFGVSGDRPPLVPGLFVRAAIEGRTLERVVALPRSALHEGRFVLVVDDADRVRFRDVDIVRMRGATVLVGAGLEPGERVVISALDSVVDGMAVTPLVAQGTTPEPAS
jgi:RND family efflux transporter MFP subunit